MEFIENIYNEEICFYCFYFTGGLCSRFGVPVESGAGQKNMEEKCFEERPMAEES